MWRRMKAHTAPNVLFHPEFQAQNTFQPSHFSGWKVWKRLMKGLSAVWAWAFNLYVFLRQLGGGRVHRYGRIIAINTAVVLFETHTRTAIYSSLRTQCCNERAKTAFVSKKKSSQEFLWTSTTAGDVPKHQCCYEAVIFVGQSQREWR